MQLTDELKTTKKLLVSDRKLRRTGDGSVKFSMKFTTKAYKIDRILRTFRSMCSPMCCRPETR